jgi:hypothetical protein
MADYKAVSMNLMHEDIRVTDGIYAPLAGDEVQRRITSLTNPVVVPTGVQVQAVDLVSQLSQAQQLQMVLTLVQQMANAQTVG